MTDSVDAFGHVDAISFKALLSEGYSGTDLEQALYLAVEEANLAYCLDLENELIPFEVIHVRAAAIESAYNFCELHHAKGVMENLKIFWGT